MIIHQALHGYSQGHNLLATSCQLSQQDDERMKMLSDWSEYSGTSDNSYITAYPLTDGRHYVVAKSWYADDMSRPGCVWTHSLIVDLKNIDDKFDFRELEVLFKRPSEGNYSSYADAIKVVPLDKIEAKYNYAKDMLIWLYVNLVNQDSKMLYRVEQESGYYQSLILLLLQYLPIETLKNVGVCSGSAYGRKSAAVDYNLQFAASVGESLFAVVNDSKEAISSVCEGVKAICKSMTRADSDTDKVLRLFTNDIGSSPLRLCGVGLLLKYLDDAIAKSDTTVSFADVLSLLKETFPGMSEGGNVKVSFCKKRVSNLFSSELDVLSEIATHTPDSWLDYEQVDYLQRVSDLKAQINLDEFVKYLSSLVDADNLNSIGELVLNNSCTYLTADDYRYIAHNHWPLYMSLVMANANILKHSFWLELPAQHFVTVYDVFRKYCFANFDDWNKLFEIVLYRNLAIDSKIMNAFVQCTDNIVYMTMEYLNNSMEYRLNSLVRDYCKKHIAEILNWLKLQNKLSASATACLVDLIDPHSEFVKNAGSGLWRVFEQCSQYEQQKYFVFLFILGHNWNDSIALQYIKRSFTPIHKALANNVLAENLWWEIEPYSAKLSFLKEWDKCKKLRKGTVIYLKSAGYPKSAINTLTDDADLKNALLRYWDKVLIR